MYSPSLGGDLSVSYNPNDRELRSALLPSPPAVRQNVSLICIAHGTIAPNPPMAELSTQLLNERYVIAPEKSLRVPEEP